MNINNLFIVSDEITAFRIGPENYGNIINAIASDIKRQQNEGFERPSQGVIHLSDIPLTIPDFSNLSYTFREEIEITFNGQIFKSSNIILKLT